ncbi:Alpha/Beta hydrolase protein [Schizophyllum amplum]|uniref:GPI inositol-deacylase n=1 Tax=Schizophyllum amplum TaxID=97359 RepID=A0A550CMC8_9AGAR|nr:Alpha/Beta hydrolase protein [Auriculariopsis ampla]
MSPSPSPSPRPSLSERLGTLVADTKPKDMRPRKPSLPRLPSNYSTHNTPSQPVLRWLGTRSQQATPAPSMPPLLLRISATHAPAALLDNLTRSTLPTASLAGDQHPEYDGPLRSPPTSSSLESLRQVSERDKRRTSSESQPSPSRASGWWFFQNKDAVDNMLDERDRGETVQEEQDNIRKKYRSPKNPIVFCHGLLGFDSVTIGPSIAPLEVNHWRGIKEVLEANGAEVLITRVPATSSPVDRAKVLEQRVSEVFPGRKVHLIGHSMGGIDCRYLTTHLTKRKFDVLSITTIASPHRGSAFADYFLEAVGQNNFPSFLGLLDLLPNGGGDGKAFEFLTLENMRRFNEDTPDVPGVKYYSWGATYAPGLIDTWKWSHAVVLEKEGPNDGLVSVESAKWGTYLGTLEGVNHLDLVGWINAARYKWAEMMGKEISFRPATFYLGIADVLAREVEGQGKEKEAPVSEGEGQQRAKEQALHSMQGSGARMEADGERKMEERAEDMEAAVDPPSAAVRRDGDRLSAQSSAPPSPIRPSSASSSRSAEGSKPGHS